MTRAPDWTREEFETLLSNPLLSDAELAERLPQRTVNAVSFVRQGVHSFHTGRDDHQMLSKMMKDRLMGPSGPILCALCKMMF